LTCKDRFLLGFLSGFDLGENLVLVSLVVGSCLRGVGGILVLLLGKDPLGIAVLRLAIATTRGFEKLQALGNLFRCCVHPLFLTTENIL
jgi:hypothetical protein